MQVKVVFFGSLSESVPADPAQIELAVGMTVGGLRRQLCEEFPQAASALGSAMVAIDTEYSRDDSVLKDGVEVAFLPPVSGG
ncbi:MAG: molybdopterin converting factor subunit 1 [Planctomycetota bacterium]